MLYRDKIKIYVKERCSDGYGGHEEKEIFLRDIDCKITSMSLEKQNVYFGNISTTAVTLIASDAIEKDEYIKIDDKIYEIIRISKVFNKYIIDAEVKSV